MVARRPGESERDHALRTKEERHSKAEPSSEEEWIEEVGSVSEVGPAAPATEPEEKNEEEKEKEEKKEEEEEPLPD